MDILYKVGDHVKGIVTSIKPYGAFLELNNKQKGFLHLSCITNQFVEDINDYLSLGMEILCEIVTINSEKNQINLSATFSPINIKVQRYNRVSLKTLTYSDAKKRSQFKYVLENMNKILEGK